MTRGLGCESIDHTAALVGTVNSGWLFIKEGLQPCTIMSQSGRLVLILIRNQVYYAEASPLGQVLEPMLEVSTGPPIYKKVA